MKTELQEPEKLDRQAWVSNKYIPWEWTSNTILLYVTYHLLCTVWLFCPNVSRHSVSLVNSSVLKCTYCWCKCSVAHSLCKFYINTLPKDWETLEQLPMSLSLPWPMSGMQHLKHQWKGCLWTFGVKHPASVHAVRHWMQPKSSQQCLIIYF